MLKSICQFIQSEDRNSDIMDFYQEVQNGESSEDSLIECVTRILTEWKEDYELDGMNKRIKGYYDYLGIK